MCSFRGIGNYKSKMQELALGKQLRIFYFIFFLNFASLQTASVSDDYDGGVVVTGSGGVLMVGVGVRAYLNSMW